MSDIISRLEKIDDRISEDSFLANKGLSNEVGIHVFCYDPQDEIIVRTFFDKLIKGSSDKKYNLVERDLYRIFMEICDEKRITASIQKMEESKGKEVLKSKLENVATPEAFVEKLKYEPHNYGDILLLTGIGKVYPFMRAHKILDNIQHVFADIPILMLYPGKWDGQTLELFGKFEDGNYYRAFNLI